LLHQLTVVKRFIFSPEYQLDDFLKMSQINAMYEKKMISGASVIRRKLKIASLNFSGSAEPPPLISAKPKTNKLMTNNKIKYFRFVKIMLFFTCTHEKQKVQFLQKKTGKRIQKKIQIPDKSDESIKS
jgi:hypothetical protein